MNPGTKEGLLAVIVFVFIVPAICGISVALSLEPMMRKVFHQNRRATETAFLTGALSILASNLIFGLILKLPQSRTLVPRAGLWLFTFLPLSVLLAILLTAHMDGRRRN